MAKGWSYAELSRLAAKYGGPEKFIELLERAAEHKGMRKMLPWLGAAAAAGVGITIVIQKVKALIGQRKKESEETLSAARQALINGMKGSDTSEDATTDE